MRPTFSVGTPVLYVSTSDIWRITFSLSRMLSAENSANDSAQSPACRRKPLPSDDARELVPQRARLAREHERRQRAQLVERGVERGRRRATPAAAPPGSGASSVGSQSRFGKRLRCGHALSRRPAEVRAGRAVARLEGAPLAHLLELLLGLHLLGEQRRLDAVEEPFEPADELRLRDAQLGVARRVARERQRDVVELLAEVVGEDAFELVHRALVDLLERRRPASSSCASRASSSSARTIEAMRMSLVGRETCSPSVLPSLPGDGVCSASRTSGVTAPTASLAPAAASVSGSATAGHGTHRPRQPFGSGSLGSASG